MNIIIIGGIVLIIFIAIIVIAAASRGKHFEGEQARSGEEVIKTIYIYLVLLATLMMTIGGSVAAFMAIADIASPPSYYQSFADFQRMPEKLPNDNTQALNQEELKKQYDEVVAQDRQRNRERAVNSLIKSFGWIVIPFPIFIYYQKKLQHAK